MSWPWPYVVGLYYVVMTAAIYAFDAAGDDPPLVMILVGATLLAAHPLVGWLLQRWHGLALPLPLFLLAVPAGYPVSNYELLPTWFEVLFCTPLFAALIALGSLARWIAWRAAGAPIRSS